MAGHPPDGIFASCEISANATTPQRKAEDAHFPAICQLEFLQQLARDSWIGGHGTEP